MQRFAIRISVALATFFIGSAAAYLPSVLRFDSASDTAAEREVLQVEAEYIRAHLERDVVALDNILAEDFSSFGGRVRKEHRLALLANPLFTISSLSTTDVHVRVSDDEAWISGKARMRASYKEREFARPSYEFARRYVKRQGQWQIIHMSFALTRR
ncbi:MAG: nuclear transport factor 2 family protein [Pyrinomonadaceae bacterium]|nr:nuclear transport factor 2 family protein [Acidobacteriota bacterium]